MGGIYIKDMEMPNTCEECNLESFCDRWIDARKMCGEWKSGVKATIRHPECPLVELPPHGDLIERKAVGLTDFEIVMCDGDYKEGMKMLLEKIESAPTIIPASEEVYGQYTDTAGNFHWTGTHSGAHKIKAEEET